MLHLTDSVSSLAHDVAAKAQDVAQVAGERGLEWGKHAVELGRHNLEQVGVVAKPAPSHRTRNLLLILLAIVTAGIAWKVLFGRAEDDDLVMSDAGQHSERNRIHVA